MSKNTIVEYGRRTAKGWKNVTIRSDEYRVNLDDYRSDEVDGSFASVSIHASVKSTGDAEISVTDFGDDQYYPFYTINIGTGVSSSLFISPDQAKTLLGLLERALNNEPVGEGGRILR